MKGRVKICCGSRVQGVGGPARVQKRRVWRVRGLNASMPVLFNSGREPRNARVRGHARVEKRMLEIRNFFKATSS